MDIKKEASLLSHFKIEKPVAIMEVCGTHTTEFFRTGVKDIFPANLRLIDGPGCPVCVTSNEYLDTAIAIGWQHNCVITTFGDMMKVPSSYSSLAKEKSKGLQVEVVYSPMDAVYLAEQHPDKKIIFLSIGFETTAPAIAACVLEAKKKNLKNFYILPGNKLTVPAVKVLLDSGEVNIDGFILPGHVSAIIGKKAWDFIATDYGKPAVVAGFEDFDLIRGTLMLLGLIKENTPKVLNEYPRVVRDNGNPKALEILYSVFTKGNAHWRGIGVIPESGLDLKDEFADFDAGKQLKAEVPSPKEHPGCRCGELLRGVIIPTDCPLFGKACTPEHAVGPCMVSSEGPCSAYYKYGRK
ncbi:MAG: hydrogenase formation protein HypD [Spirochaetes bacterium]|nr:hydrogenase formation protein HypD [Spirochaetota bacterium]